MPDIIDEPNERPSSNAGHARTPPAEAVDMRHDDGSRPCARFSERARLISNIAVVAVLLLIASVVWGHTRAACRMRDQAFEELQRTTRQLEKRNAASYEQRLAAAFDDETLTALVERHVRYELFVDGKKVDHDEVLRSAGFPTVRIVLRETFGPEEAGLFTPKILYDTSRIQPQTLPASLQIYTDQAAPSTVYRRSDACLEAEITVTGVAPGEIVTLCLLPEFAARLDRTDGTLEIVCNAGMP